MKLALMNDWLLLEKKQKKIKTVGGLELSGSVQEEMDSGLAEVELIGDEVKTIKVADVVFYHEYDAKEIFVEGKKKWLLSEKNVLGRFLN